MSRPLLVVLLTALLLAASAMELGRLRDRRHALQARQEANQAHWQAASEAQRLVTRQGDALRDLVLATTPDDIRAGERRFESLQRACDDAQAALLARLGADPQTTADERVLLAKVAREQVALVVPVERVVSLARHNEDVAATRILVEGALPHLAELQHALAWLGALEAARNRSLELGADTRLLEMALMAILGTLAVTLAVAGRRLGTRTAGGPRASSTPARGLGVGRAACNDDVGEPGRRRAAVALVSERLCGPLDVSAQERARALRVPRAALRRAYEVAECVDGPGIH